MRSEDDRYRNAALLATLGVWSVLLSIVVIWIVLYPERQAVTESEVRVS